MKRKMKTVVAVNLRMRIMLQLELLKLKEMLQQRLLSKESVIVSKIKLQRENPNNLVVVVVRTRGAISLKSRGLEALILKKH